MESSRLFFETHNYCLFRALQEAEFPKYVWAMFFLSAEDDRSKIEKARGFFVRDATRQTKFVFAYVKDKGTAIYQLEEDKTYQRWDKRANRKRIR